MGPQPGRRQLFMQQNFLDRLLQCRPKPLHLAVDRIHLDHSLGHTEALRAQNQRRAHGYAGRDGYSTPDFHD
jgi:hypothetical protein